MPDQNYADPWRHETRVHYRLYRNRSDEVVVVCVQDFDYYDYDAKRFVSGEGWYDEAEAEMALIQLMSYLAPGLPSGAISMNYLAPGDRVHILIDPRGGPAHVVKV